MLVYCVKIFMSINLYNMYPIEVVQAWLRGRGQIYSTKRLEKLTNLTLFGHNIVWIPDEISSLANLENISLHSNEITKFPKVLFKLPNLIHIDLSNNYISDIPEDICQLKKLKFLEMTNNPVEKYPDCLKDIIIKKN